MRVNLCSILVLCISSVWAQLGFAENPQPSEEAISIDLGNYVTKGKQMMIAGVSKNASGLTYSRQTNTLFVIVDSGEIVEITLNNELKNTIRLRGFEDPEGIAHISGSTFAIVQEDLGTIAFLTLESDTKVVERNPSTEIKVGTFEHNMGLEGLTYDPASEAFFLVKERDPRKIYRYTLSGEASVPWDIESNSLGLKDLSGIFFDPFSQHLILLSHESGVAVECTIAGQELSRLSLKFTKAEGVAMDHEGNLYICGEPNSLQVFEKKSGDNH